MKRKNVICNSFSFAIWRDFSQPTKHMFGGNLRNFIVYSTNNTSVHLQKPVGGGGGDWWVIILLFSVLGTLKFKLLRTLLGTFTFFNTSFLPLIFYRDSPFSHQTPYSHQHFGMLPNTNKDWLDMIIFLQRTWKSECKRQRKRWRSRQRRWRPWKRRKRWSKNCQWDIAGNNLERTRKWGKL